MITFTLPAQLRPLAKNHQKRVYQFMFDCVWETLQSFSRNDKKLRGDPGLIDKVLDKNHTVFTAQIKHLANSYVGHGFLIKNP